MNNFSLPMGAYNPGFLGSLGNLNSGYQTPMGANGAFSSEYLSSPVTQTLNPLNMPKLNFGPQQNTGGWMGIQGLGRNLDTVRLGVGALGTVASLWNGFQQNKLAKKAFNHQKGILDTNLANQIRAYNMSIDDKFRSRAVVEGMSNADRDAAIERNRARDERRG